MDDGVSGTCHGTLSASRRLLWPNGLKHAGKDPQDKRARLVTQVAQEFPFTQAMADRGGEVRESMVARQVVELGGAETDCADGQASQPRPVFVMLRDETFCDVLKSWFADRMH